MLPVTRISVKTLNFRDAEGNRHWLESTSQPVRGKDTDDWQVVVVRDITERSLRNLQEQFLSLIGHELRTPITVIKGYTQRVASWVSKQEGDFEKPQHYLAQALSQVATLQRLIDDLMDVSRLQSGKFTINFEPVRLDTLFAQVVEGGQMLTKKPLVVQPIIELEPLWVKGDAMRLEQVILNLITNAITHAPSSSKISLSLKKVAERNLAEIRVQDYGVGIIA